MYKLNIIDNYISVDILQRIEPYLLERKPWYFGVDGDWDDPNRKITLAHVMYPQYFTSIEKNFLSKLSENFDTSNVGRCYYNCFRKCDSPGFHTDPGGCTYMIYLNHEWDETWGGHTEFKSTHSEVPTRIIPKPGRLVVFDARWLHRGTEPSPLMPDSVMGRLSVAFQCPENV